jgi:hypothetical protein
MRIKSNAVLIGRRRSNRAITVSSMSCSYGTGRVPGNKMEPKGQETGQAVIFSLAAMSKRWFDMLPADLQSMVLATAQEIRIEVNPWEVDFLARQRRSWVEKGGDINILPAADHAAGLRVLRLGKAEHDEAEIIAAQKVRQWCR